LKSAEKSSRREHFSGREKRALAPLWVWIAFVMIGVGIVAYIVSYSMFENIIAFLG
jgi:ABC-type lipoprotein release transport system permease subunit